MLGPFDALRFVGGTLLYLLPGLLWTWALVPRLSILASIPVAIVVAFTLQPGLLFLLHLTVGIAITAPAAAFLSAALAAGGAALLVGRAEIPWALDAVVEDEILT